MDSLKSDPIRKIFGAVTPGRAYEQHFGRTAGEGVTLEEARQYVETIQGDLLQLGLRSEDIIIDTYELTESQLEDLFSHTAQNGLWLTLLDWIAQIMTATGEKTADEAFMALPRGWKHDEFTIAQIWAAKQDFMLKNRRKNG